MTFAPDALNHVRRTWVSAEAVTPQAATIFYHRLFEAALHLRSLFRGDMNVRGRKLMDMIVLAVAAVYGVLADAMIAVGETVPT